MDAKMNKTDLQIVADQTKRLLNNIIPDHVVRKLQVNQVYSEDHQMVGVFFATITNFLELYEENFESGKEFIRCVSSLFFKREFSSSFYSRTVIGSHDLIFVL